ncbi:hypothetical protein C8J57DRAFT_1260374 [Mycena rebaudengoi]|nr:hypothetical protein C8J57DRAFT_1260374 [Mycena rebaudengoi]
MPIPLGTPQNLSLLCFTLLRRASDETDLERKVLGRHGGCSTVTLSRCAIGETEKAAGADFRSIIRRMDQSEGAGGLVEDLGQLAEQKKTKSVRGTENGAAAAVLSVPQCIKEQSGG